MIYKWSIQAAFFCGRLKYQHHTFNFFSYPGETLSQKCQYCFLCILTPKFDKLDTIKIERLKALHKGVHEKNILKVH